jgi:hypothetical protein
MLRLSIVVTEEFDELSSEFVDAKTVEIELEHSLVSLSKWECKYEKPFLGDKPFLEEEQKTEVELLDYIRMMIIGPVPPEDVLAKLSKGNIEAIETYINAKMTATWFSDDPSPSVTREIVTAEIIYYWMISLGVPFECQHWHLNRLLTLLKVCNLKNQPKKNMTRAEAASMQSDLNQRRRAELGTKG